MKKERIEWVDIAKGIGILLVIFGHCVYLGKFAHNWIFSFHMPLFFVLSGLFFKEMEMVPLIKKKLKQLVIPYVIFCFIGLLITLLIPAWRNFSIKDILRELYWGYPNSFNVSSVWFLICLFVVVIMFNIVLLLKDRSAVLGYGFFIFIVMFGFALGRFPQILATLPSGRMPLDIDCACVALLFFGIGYWFKDWIFHFVKRTEKKGGLTPVCLLIASLAILIANVFLNGTVNLHGITYHNELLYIVGSIAGFAFVVFLSLLLQKTNGIKSSLRWFGVNSLKIMGVQAIAIRLYILIVNSATGSEFKLYFLPPFYAIAGCIVVTLLSGISVTAYNYVKRKLAVNEYRQQA